MEPIGVQRVRGRDLATGIVLGAAIGLTALFLYLDTTTGGDDRGHPDDPLRIDLQHRCLHRPDRCRVERRRPRPHRGCCTARCSWLANADIAAARGVRVRLVGIGFMLALAVAVGLSSLAIGAILSTTLLIGPAATALRLTNRFGAALAAATAIGVGATWLGTLLAYDSYYWGADHAGFPVSSFIVLITFAAYLLSGIPPVRALTGHRRGPLVVASVAER